MKTKITLFVAVIAVSLFGMGCSSLDKGLVAYYPFNGNYHDESGNQKDGQASSVTSITDRHGVSDSALSFLPRKNSYIEIPESNSSPWASIQTVSVWVKMRVENNHEKRSEVVLRNYQDNTSSESGWTLHLLKHSSDNKTHIEWISKGRGGHRILCPIDNGKWFNLVVLNREDSVDFYINGVMIESQKAPSPKKAPNGRPLLIGGFLEAGSVAKGRFNGEIDDIRIYNRALSAEEVKALYELEKPKSK